MFKRILASTDGSELSLKGVAGAAALASSLGAQLLVLMVEEPYSYANVTAYRPESFEGYEDRVKMETEAVFDGAMKAASLSGVVPELLSVRDPSPAEAIVRICRERSCDLIAMASRGRSGLSAVILGSVTRKVLSASPVPVLVYR
ncbi:MAG: universal stress protein [Sutterellaceae bacterium]|nr:universal stress protein [Sutterellaceae bacterium]MDD7441026.1 universal stress protein [Sutterellaceae bacterium]MDY2867398.1 universal stress protein [Mesosutterella sp.]